MQSRFSQTLCVLNLRHLRDRFFIHIGNVSNRRVHHTSQVLTKDTKRLQDSQKGEAIVVKTRSTLVFRGRDTRSIGSHGLLHFSAITSGEQRAVSADRRGAQ